MKKRVRIYKPTNKFEEGGQQSEQFTPDQLVSIYMTALSEPGSSAEDAEDTLRQIGIDEDTISEISDNAGQYIDDEQYFNEALTTEDEDALTDITADQAAEDAAYEEEQNALAEAEEEARRAATQQMYEDYNQPDYSDDTDVASQIIQRYGGVPSKKTFVNNALKQVKKQMGGPSESSSVDSTDPDNNRKNNLQAFTSAIQVAGDLRLAKEDAKKAYEMLTTPVGGEESYYESPDMDYAQYGGMRRGQARRMDRRLNRMIRRLPIGFSGVPGGPMLPGAYDYTDLLGAFGQQQMPAQGSTYGGPRLANIDVRRTGLFGRPKEYTITFADDVVNNPQTRENTIKQEIKNKEEEIKDEVKAAEEGTVDQGVEQKKAEEAAKTAEEADININDIQVVSGSKKTSSSQKGTRPSNKPATTQSSSTKSKAPIVKKPGAKPVYDSFGSGPRYTISDTNPRPLPQGRKKYVYGPKGQSMADYIWDYVPSGKAFKEFGQKIGKQASDLYESLPDIPGFQEGGFSDEDSGLYKFIYGGDEGKLTDSPYFAYGGMFETAGQTDSTVVDILDDNGNVVRQGTLAEAERTGLKHRVSQTQPQSNSTNTANNTVGYSMPTLSTRQRRMPYITGTRQTYTGDLSNAKVKSIADKKTRAFGPYKGMPKKYTVNYQVERDPLSKRLKFDESGMSLDGQPMSNIAPTRQGMFNRQQDSGRTFADKMIDTGVRPISWLGSKFKPFDSQSEEGIAYTPQEQRMLRKGYDPNTGLTQEELANRNQRAAIPDSTFAFTPPEVTDADWANEMPLRDFQMPESLPIRRPGSLSTGESNNNDLIPMNFNTPGLRSNDIPYLESGVAGPMGSTQINELEDQDMANRAYGLNLLGLPTAQDQYLYDQADINAYDTQQADLQRMMEQNPDFYNQPAYNWQPDLSGSENVGFNLNPPIVTPESYIDAMPKAVAARVSNYNNRVTPQRAVPQRVVPQRTAPAPKNNVVPRASGNRNVNRNRYDYEDTKKRMNPQEKAKFQREQGSAASSLQELKNAASQGQPRMFRDTYKNYDIDPSYIKSMNKLSPSQRLQYLKSIEKADKNLYNALLLKYVEHGGYMAYGGDLPKAQMYNSQIGVKEPTEQDARFQPKSTQFNIGSPELTNPFKSSGTNPLTGEKAGVKMGTDGEYENEGVVDKEDLTDFSKRKEMDDVSVDYKTKSKPTNEDYIAGLNVFNYGANALLNKIGERGDADRERQMGDRLKSDSVYGSTGQYDRGWIETNSGLDIPSEYGQRQFAEYGGSMYDEGGDTWMSEEEIRRFLEEGGELEFV